MVEWGWIILYRRALMGRFYEFTCRAALLAVSGGDILLFTFLPAFSFRNDLRWRYLSLYVFTGILFSVGPPGAPSFFV